jgi:hypothetical protein
MKRILSLLTLFLVLTLGSFAKDKNAMPQYDISGAGSGTEGTVLVKVYVTAKSVTDADLKRAAVHGVVFRGFSGTSSGAKQPAMAPISAESENSEFCDRFFAPDGQCMNFVSIVPGSYERTRADKLLKVGAILQVDKSSLRKELERAGVVRSLSSGF